MSIYVNIDPKHPNKILFSNLDHRYKDLVNSLPSSSYSTKEDVWRVSLTWPTCLALQNTFKNNLVVGPELGAWWNNYYNSIIIPSYNLRNVVSSEVGYPKLYPHQRADVEFLTLSRRAILANGMGSGKSQSAFSAIKNIHESGEQMFPGLIVCPNSTKVGWKREIEMVYPGLNVVVVDGSSAQRKKQLSEKADVFIINWEALRFHSRLKHYGTEKLKRCIACKGLDPKVTATTCEVHVKELNEIDFQFVIADEVHRVKEPSSKVARALKAATGNADIRIALSGTPIASTPADLFSTLNWMNPEGYPSKIKFLDRFCDLTYNAHGASVVLGIKEHMKAEFFAGIDPFLRRMPKEVILPFLPPIVNVRKNVEMNAKQKKAYEQMKKHMIAELDNDTAIATSSALTKMSRLLQFSSAYGEIVVRNEYNPISEMVEDREYLVLTDPSCKVDAFMSDLEDYDGQSVVVFAQSKQLVMLLSNKLEKAHIQHGLITGDQDTYERQMHMDNFQKGKTRFILCTIQAGGTGITLTKGSVAVFLQRSWSMIDNLQAEARVHRIGSEVYDFITIVDYVTAGTVEETVFKAIETKTDNLEVILRDKDLIMQTLQLG